MRPMLRSVVGIGHYTIVPAAGGFIVTRRGFNPSVFTSWAGVMEYLNSNPMEALSEGPIEDIFQGDMVGETIG